MKRIAILISCVMVSTTIFFVACKKDSPDPNLPVLKLHPVNVTGKSGQTLLDTLDIVAPYGVGKLLISKTINLAPDDTFGVQSVTPVSMGENAYRYIFEYTYQPSEVNKLVGINFHFEDSKGNAAEKDLTINTIPSAAQIIASHKWKLISKMWLTATPPSESENDCERDNIWTFNYDDSTLNVDYGSSGCTFDGFNIYDKWWVSPDEKTFTDVYHSVFNTSQITTEVYDIQSLSNDKWVMNITLDLTVFGLSDHEVFQYVYQAQ